VNKRIEELIEQATESTGFLTAGDSVKPLPVREFNKEKFAELIVRECVTRLEQHHPFTKDPEAYLYAISLIEEHFGVES